MSEALQEELEVVTSFSIAGIPIHESIVVTWGIMIVLAVLAIWLGSGLKVENPGKKQIALEYGFGFLMGILENAAGEKGRKYTPYLFSVLMYLGVSNVLGLAGIKPPTKDLCVTAGLAICSILLIEFVRYYERGVGHGIKSFLEPSPIMLPFNILEIAIRPLSLCMRLFGNIMGAFVIMEMLNYICRLVLPIPFSCYFDIFDGLLQAYIFVFLTSLFIKENSGVEE